ncbi:MAG: hypothetical protein H7239_12155 [Flavobacterium sp.]|nr:hypothetical protein [Flavobacterium sp.]
MRKICLFCAAIALIACFDLPTAYYTFLRIVITIGAIAIIIKETQKDVNLIGIAFIGIAILFNPIIPIHFFEKSIWISIDIFSAILFLIYGFKETKN